MNLRSLLVLLSTLVSLFGIYWINAGKTALKRTGEVAGREEVVNYTLPPGFSFSIWGVIYLGFFIYALYLLRPASRHDRQLQRTAPLVTVSILLNLAWTVVVGLDRWPLAFPLQVVMLVVAIMLLWRWELGRPPLSAAQRWLSIPFGLYAGWLTVALIPFVASLLNQSGWSGGPLARITWGALMYIVAFGLVWWVGRRLLQPFFILPLAWALFGYAIRFDGWLRWLAVALCLLALVRFALQAKKFYGDTSARLQKSL